MSDQIERRLRDVLDACGAIEEIVSDLEFIEYERSLVVRSERENIVVEKTSLNW